MRGGMSWESSAEYYRIINRRMRDRLGGLHSARCLMWSFDFAEVEALQQAGRWAEATALLVEAACRLERDGAAGRGRLPAGARRRGFPGPLHQHHAPHGR